MNKAAYLLVSFLFLATAPTMHAADRTCKANKSLVGQCFSIRGRAYFSNGTPSLRIWRIGTKRILGVTEHGWADDAEAPIVPDNLIKALGGFDHFVFGDFELCPFTKEKPGTMQLVCVEKAKNLVVKDYGYGSD